MQIKIIKSGELLLANLFVGSNKIEYSDDTRSKVVSGDFSPFLLLKRLRIELEKEGVLLLIQGSRRDVYPSGLQMSMRSNGAYVHSNGKGGGELVDIFEPVKEENFNLIGTVREQADYFKRWAKSIGIDILE